MIATVVPAAMNCFFAGLILGVILTSLCAIALCRAASRPTPPPPPLDETIEDKNKRSQKFFAEEVSDGQSHTAQPGAQPRPGDSNERTLV
jgi:hypothetical protein